MKLCRLCVLIALGILTSVPRTHGQNVTGYELMPDPTLFLLREPAVHLELRLTDQQKKRLVEFNESYDGILLATRNMPPEDGQKKVAAVIEKSREHVTRSFSDGQQQRLRQIMYRLKGLPFMLIPTVAAQLELSEQQQERLASTFKTAMKKIAAVQSDTFQGNEIYEKTQQSIMAARKEEQETVFATLSAKQVQILNALVGPQFDQTQLGRVSFKAPDLTGATEWLNSPELTLEKLQGKVVALHFWAFG